MRALRAAVSDRDELSAPFEMRMRAAFGLHVRGPRTASYPKLFRE
jgi:hypothetical protein